MNNLIATQIVHPFLHLVRSALLVAGVSMLPWDAAAAERPVSDAAVSSAPERKVEPAALVLSTFLDPQYPAASYSPHDLDRRPHILVASDRPLYGLIEFQSEAAVQPVDKDVSLWNIVVTSIAEGQVIDRAALVRRSALDDETTAGTEDAAARELAQLEFRCTQTLGPGVYELKLEPSVSAGARWRDLLPWERGGSKDNAVSGLATAAPHDWTLIVLPKISGSPSGPASRATFVHWAGFPELDAVGEGLGATSAATSRFAWMLTGADREGASPSQRWADVLSRINQRLDTIAAASATGIVVDAVAAANPEDNRDLNGLLLQYVQAHGAKRGLGLWQIQVPNQPADNSDADPEGVTGEGLTSSAVRSNSVSQLTLQRWGVDAAAEDLDQRQSVAVFLRPPANTIRGQFPPNMQSTVATDLVWFGSRRGRSGSERAPRDAQDAAESSSNGAALAVFPLAHLDPAFAANTWLSDWARWCTGSTAANAPNSDCRQGLIVDESLLNGEALPQSTSVRDATQLWRSCWSDDSRWLSRTAASDARSAIASLVHVRHANVGQGSALIWINQAPWPMKVTLAIDDRFQWNTQAPPAIDTVRLAQPTVTKAGHTLVIPASSILVAHSRQGISAELQFTAEMDDAKNRIAQLTQQVTTIVENLGLLGELSGMTSTAISPAQRLVNSQSSLARLASQRTDSQRWTQSSQSAATPSATWGSSLWSTDRWSLSRAVTTTEDSNDPNPTRIRTVGTATDRIGDRPATSTLAHPSSTNSRCRNLLRNGGFEEQQQLGIPGWMHAHHPIDAVVIDSLVHSEGRHAVRMGGQAGAGASSWLISREIASPIAGRIGVSLSILGESPRLQEKAATRLGEPTPSAEIRVAVESERDGQSIRHSKMVKVNSNGKWQIAIPVLEWLDVDPEKDQNLRVTIDNFSTTSVWIDDIVVTDYFASGAERTEIQSLAYLAVQGLQHSDFRPAAHLLNNFWANDLLRIAQRSSRTALNPSETTADGASSLPRSRLPFEGGGLPTPMWRGEATPAEPERGKTLQTTIESLAPAVTDPIPSGTARSQPADSSPAPAVTAEPPASLAGRIRSWLPTPLRF